MIAALAVAGGRQPTLGNRIVLALGLPGGLAFAVATATIAYVDTFDALFPVAGLAGLWLVAVGVIGLFRRTAQNANEGDLSSSRATCVTSTSRIHTATPGLSRP